MRLQWRCKTCCARLQTACTRAWVHARPTSLMQPMQMTPAPLIPTTRPSARLSWLAGARSLLFDLSCCCPFSWLLHQM